MPDDSQHEQVHGIEEIEEIAQVKAPTPIVEKAQDEGINVQLTDVFAISIDDTPGTAANAINKISASGVNILYLYSFLWKNMGVLVFRTDNNEKAQETIIINKLRFLTEINF